MTQGNLFDAPPPPDISAPHTADAGEPDDDSHRSIREALNDTLFVEAGAGTGKTRALVDRIVALVVSGVPIEKIAAITFTERAAAELRERVRTGLETGMREHPDRSSAIEAALASLDRAQISTIHAFCQAILRTYAPEAGIDPDFGVQDEVMTQRRMQERWRLYLESLGDDQAAHEIVDRVLSLGLRTNELETLALSLASRGEMAEILAAHPPAASAPAWPDLASLRTRLQALGIDDVTAADRLRQRAELLLALVIALGDQSSERRLEILAASARILIDDKKGTRSNWAGAVSRDGALAVIDDVAGELNKTLRDLRGAALAAVIPYIRDFVAIDERARGRDGDLTFDDLILRTRRLLATSREARLSLRHRFQVLLIDEFQDTDPMQVEIAIAFATDPDTNALEPGRLFLVGDPKQSIYRFRRADMATYAHTRERMASARARFPELKRNRRSRDVILEFVNRVFAGIIGHGDDPEVQPPYREITPEREIELNGPGIGAIGSKTDLYARQVRVLEAEQIAALCRHAVDDHWQVAEREGEAWTPRDSQFRDIAILIPRRIGLTALERALSAAGVPFRVEGGSLIYRTQEVRDLINCLTAIDDPADEVAVVAALRSTAFACSDVDLARHRAAGWRFDYQHPKLADWDGLVANGLRALANFHRERHDSSLAALVERVVLDRGAIEIGILDQGDRNSFRRARFMIERARSFESAGPESLRSFVTWLETQSEAAMLDNEGAAVDDDENAVRVLTVHGAKGLEFPIVFLAGLSAAPIARPPTYSADFPGERIAVCIGTSGDNRRFTLGDFDVLNARETAHENAEFDRMLYVATTRARDHLVVSLYHGRAATSGCAARRLIDAGACDFAPELRVPGGQASSAWSPLANLHVELPDDLTLATFDEQRAELLKGVKKVEYTSATALRQQHTDDRKPEREDETEPWARGRGGTRLGRAVHAAIQSLPLHADDATVTAFSRAQATAEAIPHRVADVERLVRWVVSESAAWQRAIAADRCMREVPFALRTGDKVLEGFIDLVIQTPTGIEIVDWKTDQISAAEVPARLEQYALQAGLYVHGLETATGLPVTGVTYVFADAKRELSPGDPTTLAAAARLALAAP